MIKVSLFSQIIHHIPRNSFKKIVSKYDSDKHCKGLDSWTHLISMLFCHFGKVSSVRDISNGLRSITGNLNHLGIEKAPSKSSISYINKHREWKIFRDFYFLLLEHLKQQHSFKRRSFVQLKRKIFLLDSTLIRVCLSVFDWAVYTKQKGALKIHTVLDYDGCLPNFIHLTNGRKHDLKVAQTIEFPKGSIVVVDRAYTSFEWFNDLDSKKIFYVVRAKDTSNFKILKENEIREKDKERVLQDAQIELVGYYSKKKYPKKFRLVKIWDEETKREFTFLTNNTSWTASTIADLYKARWDIEIFFKQIKQHLKIKSFIGTSENAVLIQIWSAMICILLLKFFQEKAKYDWHLSNLITFLRLNLFVKINLYDWLNNPFRKKDSTLQHQMNLFSG